jgi:enoyl-CoA hydratase/carnithine racemase
MEYETIRYELADHVATVTLDRPDKLNSFNQAMLDEFVRVWERVRVDDDVHVVVLRAEGERAFSTGVDVSEGIFLPDNIWSQIDPGAALGPRQNGVWKPVITALHGMVAGGALYWVNECDIAICSDDATFFDPHTSYGMVAACEPIGLARRIPLGEVLRMALLGLDERISARRALEIGLVSEVLPRLALWKRADELAAIIAAKPPAAVQGTVRAIWETLGSAPAEAQKQGMVYTRLGTLMVDSQAARAAFTKPNPQIR